MTNDARGDASGSGDTLVEQGVVPAVDNLLADVTTDPEMVGLAAAGMSDNSQPRRGANHKRPWYKTPSVWWLLPITAVSAMFRASTIAPRTELFIKFACDELRPEYRVDANVIQWSTASKGTQVDVPITFVQRNSILSNRIMKATIHHPDKRCAQDPVVHRAAAKLSAGITSAQGILSCLTLGWWAQYSDRAGRTRTMGISAVAVLITDILLFLVAFKADVLPGGYRILILGGALDGLAGEAVQLGFSAVVAAGHAYIADCSSPLARSRIFSFWTGCVYAGAALGPSLGSLVNYYSNDLLSTFYICTVLHIVYGILVVFIVPESVSDEARAKAQELYEADMKWHPQTILGSLRRLTSFVRPLGVFIPKRLPTGRGSWRSRDWNLTLVGVAAAAGSYHFKFQYALKTFHWSSVQLGHWLSLVGFWRALYLSVILPVILKALYAREERLSGGTHNDDEKEAQVKRVDLLIVRASLLIDLVGYIVVGIVTSQTPFIGATIILAFGGGFAPSVQSLSLALANPSVHIARREARAHGTSIPSNAKQEIGRLFGALAVIHALGAQVVGPALFSTTFGATVGVYPRAIFWLCAIIIALALGALGTVRLDIGATTEHSAEHEPLLV
ncbi:hypothetical protein FRC11_012240 [Ceratobasidium sp. 423]|nr:hypothetical protein FRC11_012240 [Ceratobasidium sp. 423]